MDDPLRKTTRAIGLASLACLIAMVTVVVATGASQEALERVRPADQYARLLVDHAAALRLLFGIDTAFIVLFSAFFVGFARVLHREGAGRWLPIPLGLLLLTAILDMVEDHHILSLLAAAELSQPISNARIAFQQVLSSVKFHASYLGLFLFGLALSRTTAVGRVLRPLLTAGTLTLGAAAWAVPPTLTHYFDLARYLGFVAGFALAIIYLRTPSR